MKTMPKQTTKPLKGHVSDDLFGVSAKSAHTVAGLRVSFLSVVRDVNPAGKSSDIEALSTWSRQQSDAVFLKPASRKSTTMTEGLPEGCLWWSRVRDDLPERGAGGEDANQGTP